MHQIELELQNQELQERDTSEALAATFTDLYDFAPVGYFSVDQQGAILELNLIGAAMLGTERSILVNQRLQGFVATSNFAYDGSSRRTSIIEKNSSGTVISTKLYVWVGNSMAEERNATNVVQKRFYGQGEQQSGTAYFYTSDHLGSTREFISTTGAITSRLSYDVYGRTTVVSGTTLPTVQYATYYNHTTSGLYLTLYRAFDPKTGRWLSRDPIAESGPNLYSYVLDDPADNVDALGLTPKKLGRAVIHCRRCKENLCGPIKCRFEIEGAKPGPPFDSNTGYNFPSQTPGSAHSCHMDHPPGLYDVVPKPPSQYQAGDSFPAGTPSVTTPGQPPVTIITKRNGSK